MILSFYVFGGKGTNKSPNITNKEVDAQSMKVRMVNATGGVVYEGSVNGSAFEPGVIDCTSLAPGVYSVAITMGGQEYKQTVVKK